MTPSHHGRSTGGAISSAITNAPTPAPKPIDRSISDSSSAKDLGRAEHDVDRRLHEQVDEVAVGQELDCSTWKKMTIDDQADEHRQRAALTVRIRCPTPRSTRPGSLASTVAGDVERSAPRLAERGADRASSAAVDLGGSSSVRHLPSPCQSCGARGAQAARATVPVVMYSTAL
jgi:hypothetical protein